MKEVRGVTDCIEVRWEHGRPAGILGSVEEWESVRASARAVERVGPCEWPAWKDVYRVLLDGAAPAAWRHYVVAEGAIDARNVHGTLRCP
jgi:hypothetical protein